MAPSSPNARASLEDATAIIGPEFDVGEIAQEVDTLAGYIATRIGRLPVRGEVVPGPGRFEIEVLDADPRRVKLAQDLLRARTARARRGRDLPDHLPGHQPALQLRRQSQPLHPTPRRPRPSRDPGPPRPFDRPVVGLAA